MEKGRKSKKRGTESHRLMGDPKPKPEPKPHSNTEGNQSGNPIRARPLPQTGDLILAKVAEFSHNYHIIIMVSSVTSQN